MISSIVAGVFYVALIFVLVRPGSRGAQSIESFGDLMGKLIGTVTEIAQDTGDEESTGFDGVSEDGNIDITED